MGANSLVLDNTDLLKLDGITNGAGLANKALVLDGNADIASGLRNATLSGDLTVNGSLIALGNASSDAIGLTGSISTHILPLYNQVSSLGTSSKQWKNVYGRDLHGALNVDVGVMEANGVISGSYTIAMGANCTSVTLPAASTGKMVFVKRHSSSNVLVRVTASAGNEIDDGPYHHVDLETAGASLTFLAMDAIAWTIV